MVVSSSKYEKIILRNLKKMGKTRSIWEKTRVILFQREIESLTGKLLLFTVAFAVLSGVSVCKSY